MDQTLNRKFNNEILPHSDIGMPVTCPVHCRTIHQVLTALMDQ